MTNNFRTPVHFGTTSFSDLAFEANKDSNAAKVAFYNMLHRQQGMKFLDEIDFATLADQMTHSEDIASSANRLRHYFLMVILPQLAKESSFSFPATEALANIIEEPKADRHALLLAAHAEINSLLQATLVEWRKRLAAVEKKEAAIAVLRDKATSLTSAESKLASATRMNSEKNIAKAERAIARAKEDQRAIDAAIAELAPLQANLSALAPTINELVLLEDPVRSLTVLYKDSEQEAQVILDNALRGIEAALRCFPALFKPTFRWAESSFSDIQ